MQTTYVKDYTNTFIIHQHEYLVTAPARFDATTDELVDDIELDDGAVAIANQMYRQEIGLVSADDIKQYRAKINLSQREFAKLLGWSPNTVALYETDAFPSEANNKILKILMTDDHLLMCLFNESADKLSKQSITSIKGYLQTHFTDTQLSVANLLNMTTFSIFKLPMWSHLN